VVAAEALTADDNVDATTSELEPDPGLVAADGSDAGFGDATGAAGAGVAGEPPLGELGDAKQHDFPCAGVGVLGAETPAMPDPRPSFCRLVASNLPLGSRPLAD
jgi:hypothetical protein